MMRWGWVVLGVFFWVAGCGKAPEATDNRLATFDVPELDSQRDELLHRFPLLNEKEEESAPRDPETGRSPFGALVYMPSEKGKKGGVCSVAHVSPGKVTANAHCIEEGSAPSDYFVIFYNIRNWKRYERVVAFDFIGDSEALDVAVLRINPEVARNWDTVDGRNYDGSDEIDRKVPVNHDVTVWSFNPIQDNHPELFKKYGQPGMRFFPKHCRASRTAPRLYGIAEVEGQEVKVHIISDRAKSKMHWFIDGCDAYPVKGNSGSLITDSRDIRTMLGVYHWNVPGETDKFDQFLRFEYRGNDDQLEELDKNFLGRRGFFGVGSDFQYLIRLKPELF